MARPTRAIGASAAEPGPATAFRCSVRHFDAKPMSRSDHSHPALFSGYSGREFAEGSGQWSVFHVKHRPATHPSQATVDRILRAPNGSPVCGFAALFFLVRQGRRLRQSQTLPTLSDSGTAPGSRRALRHSTPIGTKAALIMAAARE
jgi:hypothetical protein